VSRAAFGFSGVASSSRGKRCWPEGIVGGRATGEGENLRALLDRREVKASTSAKVFLYNAAPRGGPATARNERI